MDVRDIMTTPARTLYPEDTLNCAVKLMRDYALGCVPVVGTDGRLLGVLTDRDVSLAAYEYGEALWKLRIGNSMHAPVFTCRADDSIEAAARTMREHRVRRLPVVDDANRPIGIVSVDDLAHAARAPMPGARSAATPGLTVDELGDVYDATSGRSKHARSDG